MRLFLWASVHIRKNRKGNVMNELERLMKRYPQLVGCREAITETYQVLEESFRNGGKLLICGNGGSAADSDHIVGELMKGFKKQRPVPADMSEKLGEDLADHLQGSRKGKIRRAFRASAGSAAGDFLGGPSCIIHRFSE